MSNKPIPCGTTLVIIRDIEFEMKCGEQSDLNKDCLPDYCEDCSDALIIWQEAQLKEARELIEAIVDYDGHAYQYPWIINGLESWLAKQSEE